MAPNIIWGTIVASLVAAASAALGVPLQIPSVIPSAIPSAISKVVPTGMSASVRKVIPTALPGLPVNMPTLEEFQNAITLNGSIRLPEIIYFPDDKGKPKPAKLYGNETKGPVFDSDIFFKLYTRGGSQDGESLVPGDVQSLRSSSFNASLPTFFVTHGFLQSIQGDGVQKIKDMYLEFHEGNVIAVDWSSISSNWLYFIVKMQITEVGQFLAGFTAFLVRESGADVSKMHLIGHSLGAHVMGIAGKHIHLNVGKKVGRITGLDPAGPLFSIVDPFNRIDKDDADFVDVIHTCGGWLGLIAPVGHVDFYPNGGYLGQPGCEFDFLVIGVCSHSRAWELFAESINSSLFYSKPCLDYPLFKLNRCQPGENVPMGHYANRNAMGRYFLKTSDDTPFALGI